MFIAGKYTVDTVWEHRVLLVSIIVIIGLSFVSQPLVMLQYTEFFDAIKLRFKFRRKQLREVQQTLPIWPTFENLLSMLL